MPTIRLAAGAGAALLLITSSGHPLVVAVLLGVAALDATAGLAAALAGLSAALRWGTGALDAAAGAQAVLGPAVLVGPEAAAAGSALAALALLVAAPRGWVAVPFGLAAGLVVAGPAAATVEDAVIRFGAATLGVGLAVVAGRVVPQRVALPAAAALGLVAVVLQVIS